MRSWAWGAAHGLDYLETDPAIDAKKVGIEGVSRYGKAALVTLAFEPRFATGLGLIGSSGKGAQRCTVEFLVKRLKALRVEDIIGWQETT